MQRDLILGIGCTRNTPLALLVRGIEQRLREARLAIGQVLAIASIDSKREEAGLLALAELYGWPLHFYTAEQLRALAGQGSAVVLQHSGTPAVAEPAACLLAGTKTLLLHKTVYAEAERGPSMTLAVARKTNADA